MNTQSLISTLISNTTSEWLLLTVLTKKGDYAGPITMTAGLLPDAPTLAQGSVDNQHIRITITDGAQTGSSAISQYNYKYR
jgi:hypothetical protein